MDIRDREKLKKAIKDIEFIFHEASQVGVGQSMYEIEKYVAHSSYGQPVLIDLLVNTKNKVGKIVVASSMSIYGEGAYKCKACGRVYPQLGKNRAVKRKKEWEMKCPKCAKVVSCIPTPQDKPLSPTSIYADH